MLVQEESEEGNIMSSGEANCDRINAEGRKRGQRGKGKGVRCDRHQAIVELIPVLQKNPHSNPAYLASLAWPEQSQNRSAERKVDRILEYFLENPPSIEIAQIMVTRQEVERKRATIRRDHKQAHPISRKEISGIVSRLRREGFTVTDSDEQARILGLEQNQHTRPYCKKNKAHA